MNLHCALIYILTIISELVHADSSPFHYEYKNKFYYIETYYKATFFKAFMSCSRLGMNLLSIDTEEEFDKIHDFIRTKTHYETGLMFWTSGAAAAPKQFYWMRSGLPVKLKSKWGIGQPSNNGDIEFCLHLWLHPNNKLILNDALCVLDMYYICESRNSE